MKYLSLWKVDTTRIPSEPKERLKQFERQSEAIDALLKNGAIKEFGFFDVERGYAIIETPSRAEAMSLGALFYPYVHNEPFEIIPLEQATAAIRGAYSMQAQAV